MNRNYFHLHLVSDSTGETLITVSRAAAAQYQGVASIEHIYPLIRNHDQLDRVIAGVRSSPGIVLYTLVDGELGARLEQACAEIGAPAISVLAPVLATVSVLCRASLQPEARRSARLERGLFQAHRRLELYDDA